MTADYSDPMMDAASFEAAYGEPLDAVLNLDSWAPDPSLSDLFRRVEEEVCAAVEDENRLSEETRSRIFARIADPKRPGAPPNAGVYSATLEQIQRQWKQILFNGAVEVCDGTRVEHETLAVTITQIGVCLASYQGNQQSYVHRLFQRDLRMKSEDPVKDLMAALDSRMAQGEQEPDPERRPSELFRRGIMTYAERAALVEKSNAIWRMGHGHPAPYELLTGSGSMKLLRAGLGVVRKLVEHEKFVFVPSGTTAKHLLMVGYALPPGWYAIVQTAEAPMERVVSTGKYSPEDADFALKFCKEVGPQIAMGVYRASAFAPPYLFYSHVEHSHEAALIGIADSLLQEHRGFPLLIDLADRLCQAAFGNDIFEGAVQSAYARAGAPYRFLGERQTRR